VSEAQRLGCAILGPDVNESADTFMARGRAIRVGLCQIKGLSRTTREKILRERDRSGSYADVRDFLSRTGTVEAEAERLALAGAFDSLEPSRNRSQIFWSMRCFYQDSTQAPSTPRLRPFSRLQRLRCQYRMLRFLTEVHPVTLVPRVPRPGSIRIGELRRCVGRTVVFLGWCITSKTIATQSGESMQFVTFEDETGLCESVVFPDAYRRFVRFLAWQEAFWVTGKVQEDFGTVVVVVSRIEPALAPSHEAKSSAPPQGTAERHRSEISYVNFEPRI
jgi:DNA polymerase III alpha subunit